MYSTIVKQLDASRRLEQELKLQRHQHQIEKKKIDNELQSLKRSRKNFIQSQLTNTQNQYVSRLKQDPQVTKQHLQRQKKSQIQRSKIAQSDFEKQRAQLIKQRNHYDNLQREFQTLDRNLVDLKNKSKIAHEQQERRLVELQIRRKQIVKLLNQSKDRELIHYDKARTLAA